MRLGFKNSKEKLDELEYCPGCERETMITDIKLSTPDKFGFTMRTEAIVCPSCERIISISQKDIRKLTIKRKGVRFYD